MLHVGDARRARNSGGSFVSVCMPGGWRLRDRRYRTARKDRAASRSAGSKACALCSLGWPCTECTMMAIGTPAEIRGNKQVRDAYLGN